MWRTAFWLVLAGWAAGLNGQTVSDIDGNLYPVVVIGNLEWMAENLRTTRFRDGSGIPEIQDSVLWAHATQPGFCWYGNTSLYKNAFGALYNAWAAGSERLAPEGWRVANDSDWIALELFLGGAVTAGGKIKSKETVETGGGFWYTPNAGADNSSGFSARGAGCRESSGFFGYRYSHAWFWSPAGPTGPAAVCRKLSYNYADVVREILPPTTGMSVRCVREAPQSVPPGPGGKKARAWTDPSDGSVRVEGLPPGSHPFTLVDPAGRIVASGVLSPESRRVKAGDLPAGVYLLRIGSGDGMIVIKYLKNQSP